MQAGYLATEQVNMPTFRNGSSGEAVRFLQKLLITYGFLEPHLLTGNFAIKTEEAVRNFQQAYNLTIDGIVGNQSWWQLAVITNFSRN